MMPDNGQISFIPVGPQHAAVLAALHKPAFDHPWDQKAFASSLTTPGIFGFIACNNEGPEAEPLGFILCRAAAGEAEVLTITTLQDQRGQGLATGLLKTAIAIARIYQVEQFFLEVAEDNQAAIGLYHKVGFKECGRRKAYYKKADGSRSDAIMLQKMLHPDGAA